jgi:surface carbohydrate biosynthesis protein
MRTIYFFIEESDREIDSRLLVASELLARGYRVVMGNQWVLTANLDRLPHGIIVFKGNNSVQANAMRRARVAGFHIASIEEEVFGLARHPHTLTCFDRDIADCCDLFLAQGDDHGAMLVEERGMPAANVVVTGNPRADLLRPDFTRNLDADIQAIRDRFGRFLLVNTNFTGTNHRDGDPVVDFEFRIFAGIIRDDEAGMEECLSLLSWEKRNLRAVMEFIGRFREASPETQVVIRPHPGEKMAPWHGAVDGLDGVHVVREGGHLRWTAASAALVHTSCTTGLEAFLLGRPVIGLGHGETFWEDLFAANLIIPAIEDLDQGVARALAAVSSTPPGFPDRVALEALRPALRVDAETLAASHVAAALDTRHREACAERETRPFPPRLPTAQAPARSLRKSVLSGIDFRARLARLPAGLAIEARARMFDDQSVELTAA